MCFPSQATGKNTLLYCVATSRRSMLIDACETRIIPSSTPSVWLVTTLLMKERCKAICAGGQQLCVLRFVLRRDTSSGHCEVWNPASGECYFVPNSNRPYAGTSLKGTFRYWGLPVND